MLSDHQIIHPLLLGHLSSLGHGQRCAIVDAGVPLRNGPTIDFALTPGIVSFDTVVKLVCRSLAIEAAFVATETTDPQVLAVIESAVDPANWGRLSHADLKEMVDVAELTIRTGECTPFANVVLTAGVTF